VGEAASIGSKEFVDLRPLVGDMLETGVHVIDDNDDLDRRLASRRAGKSDGLRNIIIQDSEVLLLKAAYRLP